MADAAEPVDNNAKRRRFNANGPSGANPSSDIASKISDKAMSDLFKGLCEQLDKQGDTREGLVRESRQLTADSKKVIFMAQRGTKEDRDSVLAQAQSMLAACCERVSALGLQAGQEPLRFYRSYSPGLEEFLEAVLTVGFLETGSVLPLSQVRQLVAAHAANIEVTAEVYQGALADLTGELRRMVVNSINDGDKERAGRIAQVIREVVTKAKFALPHWAWTRLTEKMNQMEGNLKAVEDIIYSVVVREAEGLPTLKLDMDAGQQQQQQQQQDD